MEMGWDIGWEWEEKGWDGVKVRVRIRVRVG